MTTQRRFECLDALTILAAEANTALAGEICQDIATGIETDDDVHDWLWAIERAHEMGILDADQRFCVINDIFTILAAN